MEFNRQIAIHCARAVQSLYDGSLRANVFERATDTEAWVGGGPNFWGGEFRYVLFPGTETIQDWMTDLKIRKCPWSFGQVHRGFQEAFGSVATEITAMLPENSEVVIAGHSLGGALATLFASALHGFRRVHAVYTFGSPRVGNRAFARHYNDALAERSFRIVNAGDPVPRLPWMLGTYRHVDHLTYLNRDGGIDENRLAVAAKEFLARMELAKRQAQSSMPVSDLVSVSAHSLTSYIKKLEALR